MYVAYLGLCGMRHAWLPHAVCACGTAAHRKHPPPPAYAPNRWWLSALSDAGFYLHMALCCQTPGYMWRQ